MFRKMNISFVVHIEPKEQPIGWTHSNNSCAMTMSTMPGASDKQAGFKNIWIYLRMDNSRFKDRQIERFTDRSGRVNVIEILTEVRKKKWLNDTPWLIQVTS